MASIFTKPMVSAMKKGLASCQTCKEEVSSLRRMGFPNEALESDLTFLENSLQEGLKIHSEYEQTSNNQ